MKKILFIIIVSLLLVSIASAEKLNAGKKIIIPLDEKQINKDNRMKTLSLDSDYQQITKEDTNKRIISYSTGMITRWNYEIKGCSIIHKLKEGTAMSCPEDYAKQLLESGNAVVDHINKISDLESDYYINADYAWKNNYTGSDVIVAVLDTGVQSTHPELADSIIASKSFTSEPPDDYIGHGTHVAGIITANGGYNIPKPDNYYDVADMNDATGAAKSTKIMSLKVCSFGNCYDSDVTAGIEWAVDNGADIISMSFGGGNYSGPCDDTIAAKAANWAVDQGVVVIASVGNSNAFVNSPACASKVIAVGAVYQRSLGDVIYPGPNDTIFCEDTNTYADLRVCFSNYGSDLDLMAPGAAVLSTYPGGYTWMFGTSQAAPHVSAVAALILDKNPDLSPEQVKDILKNTSRKNFTGYNSFYYGAGIVDAKDAFMATPEPQDLPGVPEFSILTSLIMVGLAGIYIYRRRE